MEMSLEFILTGILIPLASAGLVFIINYYVQANQQKNDDMFIKKEIQRIDKDISKNNKRGEKQFEKLEKDVSQASKDASKAMQKFNGAEITIEHLKRSLNDMSGKIDVIFQAVVKGKTQ